MGSAILERQGLSGSLTLKGDYYEQKRLYSNYEDYKD